MQKPEPKLNHMPLHIKQKITDSARNVGTKLALSQMSKEFQSLAEESPIKYDELRFEIDIDKVSVIRKACILKPNCGPEGDYLDGEDKKHAMEFSAHKEGVLMKNPTSDWQKVIPETDFRKAAVHYLLGIMGPKTSVEKLAFEADSSLSESSDLDSSEDPEDEDYPAAYPKRKFEEDRTVIMNEIEQGLQAKKHHLLVETLDISFLTTSAHIMQILPYLEPGTLSDIDLYIFFPILIASEPQISLDEICETDQWKRAKGVTFSGYKCDDPFEKWCHFTNVDISQHRLTMSLKALLEAFLSRPHISMLGVGCSEDLDKTGLSEYLEQLELLPEEDSDSDSDSGSDSDSDSDSDDDDNDNEDRTIRIRMPNEPNTRIKAFIARNFVYFSRLEL